MKTCTRCKIEKKLEEFSKLKTSKDGHNSRCRSCLNEASREWVKKNPEKRKAALAKYDSKGYWERNREKEIARNNQWKKDNAERVLQTSKEWRKRNPEKVKEHKKKYYQRNKDKVHQRTLEYLKKNPEKRKEYYKKTKEKKSYKEWLKAYQKKRAAHRTVEGKARKMVHYAVMNGGLIRPEMCSKCNKKCKPEGHHFDYSKPLEVIWLCRKCHVQEHKK